MTAKTNNQRQADHVARQKAAGNVLFRRWVHPDDKQALSELAAKLADQRHKPSAD